MRIVPDAVEEVRDRLGVLPPDETMELLPVTDVTVPPPPGVAQAAVPVALNPVINCPPPQLEPRYEVRLPFTSYNPSELVARLIFHWLPENWSVPVLLAGNGLPFRPLTTMESVIAVVPLAVPVASPVIVKTILWFALIQLTVSDTEPVEFPEVTQPCPVKDVTPVLL